MNKATIHNELKEWFEWTKENTKSMITQIIRSKELTSSLNKISSKDKQILQREIDTIVEKVIDKEIDYYIQHYKIKSKDEYANLLDRLSIEEILKTKRKCCDAVLEEMISKNGK